MSVLIKGMEKPKSCTWWDGRCPLLGDDDDCKLQDCQEEWTWQDQYKGCPLSDAPDTNVDTISRQDVLALAKDVTLQNGCKHRCIDATMIHELPPAQLGTMAVRGYPIDADCLMAKVAEEYGERARDALYRIIRYMPSAQPDIIHCWECKHSEHWYSDRRRCFLWSEVGISVFNDGFCNYAERREG